MHEQTDPKRDALVAAALGAFDAQAIDQAVSVITSCGDPLAAGAAFAALGKILYRDRKDVTAMIALGEAGVAFCLQEAGSAVDAATAATLKKRARGIAYNTAANCWPGWGDDGIRIDKNHLRSGLALAGTCRDLVDELQLGQEALGKADWLIGALKLAAGRADEALEDFERARRAFEAGGNATGELMARGYVALARKADPISAAVGAGDFATVLQALRNEGSKDSLFFAEQLVVAERILLAH
jgi:tetratricopeptide (TPR) repeat protein